MATRSRQQQARIEEKKEELENLLLIKEYSAKLLFQINELDKKMDQLCEGTETVANVLASWETVFKAIKLSNGKERLVRVPV